MKNAHLRLAQVEFQMATKRSTTSVRVWCDRLITDEDRGLLLSIFGNESEMSAIAGAVGLGSSLTAFLPTGERIAFRMGDKAISSRGFLSMPSHRRPIRHTLYFAQALYDQASGGSITVMRNDDDLIWATIVSSLGLPATPQWASSAVEMLRESGKIKTLDGFRCSPTRITVNREEMLQWIGQQVAAKKLLLPTEEGPIVWPRYELRDLLTGMDADLDRDQNLILSEALPLAA
jgi:hypothetical protein